MGVCGRPCPSRGSPDPFLSKDQLPVTERGLRIGESGHAMGGVGPIPPARGGGGQGREERGDSPPPRPLASRRQRPDGRDLIKTHIKFPEFPPPLQTRSGSSF